MVAARPSAVPALAGIAAAIGRTAGGGSEAQPWTTASAQAIASDAAAPHDGRHRRTLANQNFPLAFFHSARGGTGAIVSQCSAILPSRMRYRS